jgi:hypothetical protein
MLNLFGLVRYIKTDPSTYLIQYSKGKVRRQGSGLSFYYVAPSSTLVSVPLASVDLPFMFAESTADFQEITIQGRVVYRIADPQRLSGLVNYSLKPNGRDYVSDGPEHLGNRVLNQVQVAVRAELAPLSLAEALAAGARLTDAVSVRLRGSQTLDALGIALMDLAILAVKPTPETARALAAEMRERVLQDADQAVYRRRNASVDEERAIKENELKTDIAVAEKRRQVQEAEMEAKRAVAEKARTIEREDLEGRIALEERRATLVEQSAANARIEADARAYGMGATMDTLAKVDPRVLDALASTGMGPEQLIARAFQGLAEGAERIGELNISPDLLGRLLRKS